MRLKRDTSKCSESVWIRDAVIREIRLSRGHNPLQTIFYFLNSFILVGITASCLQVFSLSDSKVAEALAMRKGLEFAKDMSFLNLIAESNVSNMVLALNAHQQSPTYIGSIIGDCISFNVCFCSLNFKHVKREANQVAHYLAKWYDLHNLDCIWIENTLSYISAILTFDLLVNFY